MEEGTGVVLASKPAERDWPRLDPPNVLWFAGTYALAVGSYVLLDTLPSSHSSLWILVGAVGFVLLYAVAAVFIGGASLTGGSGTGVGTVIGSLIIAVIQFGLVFINVPPYYQFVAVGLVIIVAVLIDQSRDRLARLV